MNRRAPRSPKRLRPAEALRLLALLDAARETIWATYRPHVEAYLAARKPRPAPAVVETDDDRLF